MSALRKYEATHLQVQIRIPAEVKAWLTALAGRNGSSIAFEASRRLKQAMEAESTKSSKSHTAS